MEIFLENKWVKTDRNFLYELLIDLFPNSYKDYVLCKKEGEVCDLNLKLKDKMKIKLIKKDDSLAYTIYESSLSLLAIEAIRSLYAIDDVKIGYSVNDCLYVSIVNKAIAFRKIKDIKAKMYDLVKEDIKIKKEYFTKDEALKIFKKNNSKDELKLLKSLDIDYLYLHKLNGNYYLFSNLLLPRTSWLEDFDLIAYNPGFLINYKKENGKLREFKEEISISKLYEKSQKWTRLLDIDYASDINELVNKDKIENLIKINETYYNNQLEKCACDIINKDMKIVMLAGPSSSGKTTTAEKLAVQLAVFGKKSYIISTDDYFLDRDKTPVNEYGHKDFESLRAIDIKKLNSDLLDLLEKRQVRLPIYNFTKGVREMSDKNISLDKDNLLIIEGIHALNPDLTSYIAEKDKYKIYISVLSQINISKNIRISSSETRLIRRIVRDNKFRSYDTESTLKIWSNVKRGEEEYIFPYQNTADFYIDSALLYEFNALKKFGIEALDQVKNDSKYYYMADKLRNILKFFVAIENTNIIDDGSILREFIGD